MTAFSFFLTGFAIAIGIQTAFWLVRYMVFKLRKLHIYKGFCPHKLLSGKELLSVEGMMHDIRQLYLHGKIKNLYLGEDYISFEDQTFYGPLSGFWNIYYIKYSQLDELHYRGTFRIYQNNKKSLETMRAYLSKIG
ncbi:MAG: hypothetical protein PHT37_04310 [Candidatus Cloacimonetes bacterium]|nr:hypothetical protein [Candidatus Cloacimonadota bacterium]MDD2423818.1 hypothetical protein [Candidatus Cloacimonadota bacterium]MDD3563387.1 hypothetical protein [Candidatus Cloacimonadota bacterium]MDD4277096.1 hypothetical protein [Candidatus Cloacimonadota bacterium]MDY0325942.1 hypothetical protein [Candidatus Cloacimonadaceae bacterium]